MNLNENIAYKQQEDKQKFLNLALKMFQEQFNKNQDIQKQMNFIIILLKNIYAIGDVSEHAMLTPVVNAVGRKLTFRIFDRKSDLK